MENIFLPLMNGKTVIVGIGNPLRGDDGFGPALIQGLRGQVNCVCIDAGRSPENYVGRIVKEQPDTILLVDAVHLGLGPGQYRLLQPADIAAGGLTTHSMSSRLLIQFLEHQTQAKIFLLGVQPQTVALGDGISPAVAKALEELGQFIQEAGEWRQQNA